MSRHIYTKGRMVPNPQSPVPIRHCGSNSAGIWSNILATRG